MVGEDSEPEKKVFKIGGNTFYDRKNKIPVKIPESKRSKIGIITEFRGIPNGFPNLATMQLFNNAIWLLLGCGLYQRDFKEWDPKLPANKMWMMLKPFIQEAYQHRLNATNITADQQGYMPNAYAALTGISDKDEG